MNVASFSKRRDKNTFHFTFMMRKFKNTAISILSLKILSALISKQRTGKQCKRSAILRSSGGLTSFLNMSNRKPACLGSWFLAHSTKELTEPYYSFDGDHNNARRGCPVTWDCIWWGERCSHLKKIMLIVKSVNCSKNPAPDQDKRFLYR